MVEEQIEKLKTLQGSYDALADVVETQLPALADKIDNIKLPEIDTTELAKQGENQEATNSKILEEVQNKLTPLEAVLTELSRGKQEMVDALATKNVQSSTDKTLSAIADDVRSIAQSPITIEGGEMYEKQLFGAATDKTNPYEQPDSPMWNLYQVMENLLSDGRFVTYGGIMLGEYPAGDDTIELYGSGAGGAYLTSDGAFYEIDKTGENAHVWNDSTEKSNRWVAYLFAGEYPNFNISTLEQCPLSIHIGRKVGTLSMSIAGRLGDVIVLDGNELQDIQFLQKQKWNSNLVIRNVKKHSNGVILREETNIFRLTLDIDKIYSPVIYGSCSGLESVVFTGKEIDLPIDCHTKLNSLFNITNSHSVMSMVFPQDARHYYLPNLERAIWRFQFGSTNTYMIKSNKAKYIDAHNVKKFELLNGKGYAWYIFDISNAGCVVDLNSLETITFGYYQHNSPFGVGSYGKVYMESIVELDHLTGNTKNSFSNIEYVHIGCKGGKSQIVCLGRNVTAAPNCFDIEIGDKRNIDKGLEPRWYPCQNININGFNSVTEENMINHILKRLKQDEEMCGSGVTITLGATNLAKLTSEEAVALLDSLTNTYGYTFA